MKALKKLCLWLSVTTGLVLIPWFAADASSGDCLVALGARPAQRVEARSLQEPFSKETPVLPEGATEVLLAERGPRYRFANLKPSRSANPLRGSISHALQIHLIDEIVSSDVAMVRNNPILPGPRYLNQYLIERGVTNLRFVAYRRVVSDAVYRWHLSRGEVVISFAQKDGDGFQHDVIDHAVGFIVLAIWPIWNDVLSELRRLQQLEQSTDNRELQRNAIAASEKIADDLEFLTGLIANCDRIGLNPKSHARVEHYLNALKSSLSGVGQ